jgi:hypothetical protein
LAIGLFPPEVCARVLKLSIVIAQVPFLYPPGEFNMTGFYDNVDAVEDLPTAFYYTELLQVSWIFSIYTTYTLYVYIYILLYIYILYIIYEDIICNSSWSNVPRQLYPDAKFILTTRDVDAW